MKSRLGPLERRTLASGKTLAPLKTVRKRAKHQAIRVEGDTGRPAMKRQRRITKEMRDRSSTGHAMFIGARRTSVPHDRYKLRELLDPDDDWRNLMGRRIEKDPQDEVIALRSKVNALSGWLLG